MPIAHCKRASRPGNGEHGKVISGPERSPVDTTWKIEICEATELPITPGMLVRIKKAWEEEGPNEDKLMLWPAMLLCFFGFFRSGKICAPPPGIFDSHAHLTFADMSVDIFSNPQQLHVPLKQSKTNQIGKGTLICMGRTGR